MAAAGFSDAVSLATMEIDPANCFHVIEVADGVNPDDPAMKALPAQFGPALIDAHVIGGYARPLALSSNTGKN
jgi:hypothetical protein